MYKKIVSPPPPVQRRTRFESRPGPSRHASPLSVYISVFVIFRENFFFLDPVCIRGRFPSLLWDFLNYSTTQWSCSASGPLGWDTGFETGPSAHQIQALVGNISLFFKVNRKKNRTDSVVSLAVWTVLYYTPSSFFVKTSWLFLMG